jgi:hypothetical protein
MVLLSWYRFNGGRHPCFLFLGTLLVFQGGRLIGYMFGILPDPMLIELETPTPIGVSPHTVHVTLLILVLSALCVYAPARLSFHDVGIHVEKAKPYLGSIYALILFTLPFALYKNLQYLIYIRSHGGYLAVYTDNAAVLQSAGLLSRTMGLLNSTAVLLAYVLEPDRKRQKYVLVLFFALSTLDLLIGFRGKFFAQAVAIWFLHNMKNGRRFRLVPLMITVSVVSVLAVVIGAFRENLTLQLLSPVGLISVQGVSLNVTEAAVEFQKIFGQHGASYVWGGFLNGFGAVTAEGQLWSGDLSRYLNPVASSLGFGTASAYLAELFLWGGVTAVVLGSLAIGTSLSFLHHVTGRLWGAVVLAFVLPPLIYLPRLELLNPLAVLLKSMTSLALLAAFVVVYRMAKLLVQAPFARPGQEAHVE